MQIYWNVTSDNVLCIEFCDVDQDQVDEIIVSTEDQYIRFYKGERIIQDILEQDICVSLKRINEESFCYSLKNNSVGVYCGSRKTWEHKSKFQIDSIEIVELEEKKDSFSNFLFRWIPITL